MIGQSKTVFIILLNWWNKIYGKQHNGNGTDHSNNFGVDWEYLYYGRSKGKLLQQPVLQGWGCEWVSKGKHSRQEPHCHYKYLF